jgi:hypothetical protein
VAGAGVSGNGAGVSGSALPELAKDWAIESGRLGIIRAMRSNAPPRPVMLPHPRHRLSAVTQRTLTRAVNSVIEPTVDVAADIAAINRGEHGDRYTVNGRMYGVEEGGRAYPVAGPGIYQLGRGAFKALGIYNQFGLTDRSEAILDEMGIVPAERLAGREASRAGRQGRS